MEYPDIELLLGDGGQEHEEHTGGGLPERDLGGEPRRHRLQHHHEEVSRVQTQPRKVEEGVKKKLGEMSPYLCPTPPAQLGDKKGKQKADIFSFFIKISLEPVL